MNAHGTEQLSALLDGELSEAERARVEEHLKACAACTAERDLLASTVKSVAALPGIEPSAALRRSDTATFVTMECGGTLWVSQTLPPMTLECPTTVSPPRIVAFA